MPNELVKQISYVLYKADEEDVKVNVLLKDESIWLTQKSMAELFDCSTDNIGLHLKNIFTSVLKEYIKKGFVMDDEREIPFNMEQFAARVNEFLEFRKYDILEGNGKISRNKKVARAKQMSNIG